MNSRSASSWLVTPSARTASTSRSRALSRANTGGAAAAERAGAVAVASASTSRCTQPSTLPGPKSSAHGCSPTGPIPAPFPIGSNPSDRSTGALACQSVTAAKTRASAGRSSR
jgi:hypothetical protein